MLRFASPLTPAATAIFVVCLELASDEASDVDLPGAWQEAYPRSAACFTPALAQATLLDLVASCDYPRSMCPPTTTGC